MFSRIPCLYKENKSWPMVIKWDKGERTRKRILLNVMNFLQKVPPKVVANINKVYLHFLFFLTRDLTNNNNRLYLY